jgi:hypothetical protein
MLLAVESLEVERTDVLHQFQLMLLAVESLAVERTDVYTVGPRGWRKFYQEDGHNLEDWH